MIQGYLANPTNPPISFSLPLREEIFRGDEVYNYFDNLIPDNQQIRKKIAQVKKAQSTQTFDILYQIGGDCVGALQFLVPGEESQAQQSYSPLTEEQVADIIESLSFHPLGMDEEQDFRISIAGAQEKTALYYNKNKWSLPLGTTPTTHILKPPMGQLQNGIDLRTSVDNEWLCLEILKSLDLPVAHSEIKKFKGKKCLVVERFDRRTENSKVKRIPQEDLCQALGYPSNQKYQSDGGPNVKEIMSFLLSSDFPQEDRRRFLECQILFYLLAATDGHAKNFSLFITTTGFQLTPIYDVLSAYPAMKKKQVQLKQVKMAMSVGAQNHYRWSEIYWRHFQQTAKECGFPETQLENIKQELAEKLSDIEDKIPSNELCDNFVFETIITGLKKASKKIL